jgi:PAS domain S-box-containing protein
MDSGETHVYPNDPAAIDGEVHIFHTIKTPLRDAAGHIWGVLAFARDITEREKLLAEMEQSQELLRSVIDATPDWIVVKDREHRFRLVNQGFANSMHLTPADIIGKNDIDLGMPEEIVKGNPEKGIRGFWADDLEVMDGGQMKIIESEPTVIDGQPAFLNTIKVPMRDARGEVWGVLAYVRNITSLKQAEEAMAKRAAELACLNDISRELESSPPLPELLPWVAGRIPAAMQYPHLCAAVIEYAGQLYGDAAALKLSTQMTHGLYVSGEIVGRIYIAYTQKHDFLNEESALLGGIANRLSGYIENRRLFEQTQTRAEREQILREVTNRIRGSVDVQTIMRTAAQEVGQVLGRPAFVYLGNGGNGEQSPTGPGEKEA